ncbi:hypothetical protein BD410DRAFT_793478 [Rickenella mellea]|uniref:Ricin B lectin domain-containing protein n=1 Tax=Rickenella mellea TaxID=50990 RepID=A0A4Y7PTI3_9AGAM|nr:hypothetical protein BD410DRAFT_793478 [Rickenella mellea]
MTQLASPPCESHDTEDALTGDHLIQNVGVNNFLTLPKPANEMSDVVGDVMENHLENQQALWWNVEISKDGMHYTIKNLGSAKYAACYVGTEDRSAALEKDSTIVQKDSVEKDGAVAEKDGAVFKERCTIVGQMNSQDFLIKECRVKGTYTIQPKGTTELYLGLADREFKTPVQLVKTPTNGRNQWRFTKINKK